MKWPEPHVRAWYWYAFAAEVFAACALAMFLPITLEQMAREIGFEAPAYTVPCSREAPPPGTEAAVCKARILGVWVDTQSFSMYVKSTAVAMQALGIISIGTLADSAYWRKRLLLSFAAVGSASAALFTVLPGSPQAWLPLVAAIITVVGNVAYAASIVCANAFLPGLAREDPAVLVARAEAEVEVRHGSGSGRTSREEERSGNGNGLGDVEGDANDLDVDVDSIDEARALLSSSENVSAKARYAALLSRTMSRLSSTGVAIGFFSGMFMLALLAVPLGISGGSTRVLEIIVGLSGLWWAVFTIPAGLGLPGGRKEAAPPRWLARSWRRVAGMVAPKEIRRLPNLFTYLLAWVFLSDGFHTTTYTAILYASSTLHMSAAKVLAIGLLMQLAAVGSSIAAPRLQARTGRTNLSVLVGIVILAQLLPLYTCLGLVVPYGGLRNEWEMYVAAVWFGTLYGPFNSYARAVYAELVPPGHESTFFALFSLTDKSASFVGPLVVGAIKNRWGNIRLGFLFLTAMLALPVPVLLRVRMRRGADEAHAWSEEAARTGRHVQSAAARESEEHEA